LINNTTRSATIYALEDSEFGILHKMDFEKIIKKVNAR